MPPRKAFALRGGIFLRHFLYIQQIDPVFYRVWYAVKKDRPGVQRTHDKRAHFIAAGNKTLFFLYTAVQKDLLLFKMDKCFCQKRFGKAFEMFVHVVVARSAVIR